MNDESVEFGVWQLPWAGERVLIWYFHNALQGEELCEGKGESIFTLYLPQVREAVIS